MRKALSVLGVIFYFTLNAQVSVDSLKRAISKINPDSSAVGKPIGDSVKKMIGPEGGKISSADGMMEITFPPGALEAPTAIGIQLVASTSIMSFGNTYSCTPDGVHFQKPVQLLMHYTDSMAKGTQPSARIIRWQDRAGRWTTVENVKRDSVAHTLSVEMGHFCAVNAATSFAIIPNPAKVKINQSQPFWLTICGTYPNGKQYASEADAQANFWPGHKVEWSVDGYPGGNDKVGWIKPYASDGLNIAIYTAPAALPDRVVEIESKYVGLVPMGPSSMAESVGSHAIADIYDEFHYTFTGYDKVGHMYMIDSANCDIEAFSSGKVTLSNIQNPTPWSDWPPKVAKCSYEYPDKTGWKGMVQIEGMSSGTIEKSGGVTGYMPPGVIVTVQLTPAMGSSPTYTEHCPDANKKVPSMPVPASPQSIKFNAMQDGNILVFIHGGVTFSPIQNIRNGQGFYLSITHK